MLVYRAVDATGQEWRIEFHDPPTGRVRVVQAFGRSVAGKGTWLAGVGALGPWLVAHGLTTDDLEPA